MALTADQWHILAICLFPVINILGITASILMSASKNNTLLACGIIFSAGVLLSGALVHMLPHGTEILAKYFSEEEHHDDHRRAEEEHHDEAEEEHHDETEYEHHDETEYEHHDDHDEAEEDHGGHYEAGMHNEVEMHAEGAEHHDHPFPWSYTIFSLAFLFLLCVETCVERFIDVHFAGKQGNFFHSHESGNHEHSDEDTKKKGSGNHEHNDGETKKKGSGVAAERAHRPTATLLMPNVAHNNSSHAECVACDVEKVKESMNTEITKDEEQAAESIFDNDFDENFRSSNRRRSTWAVTAPRPSVAAYDPNSESEKNEDDQQTINPWVSILLALVLSLHVIIEGLTIGSSQDTATIEVAFIAIVVHKGFAAFSLGSSLIASGHWDKNREGGRTMFYVLTGIFISMDIIGVGVGMALGDTFSEDGLASGVLLSLLGGSFLFVAAVELIPGELEKMRVLNLPIAPIMFSLLLGFGLMTLLGNWV